MTLPRGLYAIVDTALLTPKQCVPFAESVIEGGAVMLQFRDKSENAGQRKRQASKLRDICRANGVLFIVNDDPALAAEIGANGVHLGRDDPAIAVARSLLGPTGLIGVSCYASAERAQAAKRDGADYVAFGSFYPSRTKPDAVRAPRALISEARRDPGLPIAAIGGITARNAGQLAADGADFVAVIRALIDSNDPRAAAAEIVAVYAHAQIEIPKADAR